MIGESWSDVEINLALNVNKTALGNAEISKYIIIYTLLDQFGATTQIQVTYYIFLALDKLQIQDPTCLNAISHHDKEGKVDQYHMFSTTNLFTIGKKWL